MNSEKLPTMEDLYNNLTYVEMAKPRALSAEVLSTYARELHSQPAVVADLKFAHEAKSEDYSDEDYQNLGPLVAALMHRITQDFSMEPYSSAKGSFALGDFNGWYLQEVVYGGKTFENVLSEYLKISPFVKREASL
jgi:hypothetical protein